MEVPKDIEYIPNEDEYNWSSSFLTSAMFYLQIIAIFNLQIIILKDFKIGMG